MYLEHFGLKEYPFSTSPDPRFYYPSAKHREALACLIYTVEQRKGFALISGEVGAGKTMLCRAALQRLGDGVESAIRLPHLHHAHPVPEGHRGRVRAWTPGARRRSRSSTCCGHFLAGRWRQGRNVVLIVDEAQALSAEVLEEVRLLGNLETTTEKLMQTILVGQPELRRLVGQHRLRQLDQRIAVKFHLGALSPDDVPPYIDHRLQVAGGGGIFTPAAKDEVAARQRRRAEAGQHPLRPGPAAGIRQRGGPHHRPDHPQRGRRARGLLHGPAGDGVRRGGGAHGPTPPTRRACAAPSAACT